MKRSLALLGCLVLVTPAVPAQTTWYVDVQNCPGGSGSPSDPFCSIQSAIQAAVDGDTVLVLPGAYLETIDFLGKAILVQSTQGAALTTIDAGGAASPVVRFVSGEGPGSILDGFTVTGSGNYDAPGGGVYSLGSPTIRNNVVTLNYTNFGGGGIYTSGGTIEDNVISFNVGGYGTGGVVGGDPIQRNENPREPLRVQQRRHLGRGPCDRARQPDRLRQHL